MTARAFIGLGRTACAIAVWTIAPGGANAASAQQAVGGATGAATFGTYCASCHGAGARGDGPMASVMTTKPADLTQIAQRNGGTFPTDRVAQIIDGRRAVKGHGRGEMPVWGDAFGKTSDAIPVAEKIRRLVGYLETIQPLR